MAGWRILDLTQAKNVTIDAIKGAITITSSDYTDKVPAADIALILLGTGVAFSSGSLHRLAESDVVVVLCGWNGVPYSITTPFSTNTHIGARQIAQANATDELLAHSWQKIVKAKVIGQANVLHTIRPRSSAHMSQLVELIQPGDTGQVEATAAAYYWPKLFGSDFRRDRTSDDRRNSMLNYGYSILLGHGVRAVLAAGLSPVIGMWHSHRSNAFNLVSDLMEPYRPAIDFAVANAPSYSSLKKPETKKYLAAACTAPFGASQISLPASLSLLAGRYALYLERRQDFEQPDAWQSPTSVNAARATADA